LRARRERGDGARAGDACEHCRLVSSGSGAHAAAIDKAREAITVAQERRAPPARNAAPPPITGLGPPRLRPSNEKPDDLVRWPRLVDRADAPIKLTVAGILPRLLERRGGRLSVGAWRLDFPATNERELHSIIAVMNLWLWH